MRKYTISFSIAVLIFWCYFVSHEKNTLFLGTEKNWKGHLLNISLLLAIENSFPETCHSVLRGTILRWWKMKWPCQRTAKPHWLQQFYLCNKDHSRKDATLFPSFSFQRKVGKRKCCLYNQQITILSERIQFLLVQKFFNAAKWTWDPNFISVSHVYWHSGLNSGVQTPQGIPLQHGKKMPFLPLINKTKQILKIVYTWSFSHSFLLSILCMQCNRNWHFNGGVKSTSYNAKDIVIYTLIICLPGFGFFSVCLLGVFSFFFP